jgi:hypothetical protein
MMEDLNDEGFDFDRRCDGGGSCPGANLGMGTGAIRDRTL